MGHDDCIDPGRSPPGKSRPDRYEPLPGIVDLPGWLWRRTGRALKIGAAVGLLAIIAAGIALAPGIRESKQEQARAEQRERAAARAELIRRLEAEQRPRFGRSGSVAPAGAAAAEQLSARATVMEEVPAAIEADARRRVRLGSLEGPVLRVECEPFPRTVDGVGAHEDLSRRRGRYSCIAVTAEIERSEQSVGAVLGHRYRTQVDFATGRYAFCKVAGQSGPSREQLVTTPRACGG
jgi:hypothetical protein